MKKSVKILTSILCGAALLLPLLATACGDNTPKHTDYASQLKLDFNSETKKQEVTVRLYVDGDTTHFNPVSNSSLPGCNNAADFSVESAPTKGYAKARYLAVNTPESTGQIEEWGHAASDFTYSKLEKATSVIIESDDENWNIDSTGGRYLLWVWYMPEGETEYRNLNLEILQAGLAYASSTADTRYGETCMAALNQAQAEKLYCFSGEKDPDYYYGGPINVTLKELRFNTAAYEGKRIMVEGTVVAKFNNSAYIEELYYDIEGYEEGIKIGMPVYYSYRTGKVVEILSVGNKVSVSGVIQFYKTGGYYQITDIKDYNRYNTADPNNCNVIEEVGLDNAYTKINPADFISTTKTVDVEIEKTVDGEEITEVVSLPYCEALLGTSVSVENVTVTHVSTTVNEESNSYGAMTLTCETTDGVTFKVRTEVLYNDDGKLMDENDYINKKINVKGIVEYYSTADAYQIKCHRYDYIDVLGN